MDLSPPINRSMASQRYDRVVVPSGPTGSRPSAQVLLIMWRGRWIVCACVALSFIVALIYLSRAVPVYSASSDIYVDSAVPSVVSDALSNQGNRTGFLNWQCEIIHSTKFLSDAAQAPGLMDCPTLKNAANPVAFLKGAVVAGAKDDNVLSVSMQSTSAEDAALIVNGVVDTYLSYQGQQHQSTATQVLTILQKQWAAREAELTQNEAAIMEFKKANPALSFETENGHVVSSRFSSLEEALTRAQIRSLDLQIAVQEAEVVKGDAAALKRIVDRVDSNGAGTDLDPLIDSEVASEYHLVRGRILDDTDTLGSSHPMFQSEQARLNSLKSEMAREMQQHALGYVGFLREELDAAQLEEKKWGEEVDKERHNTIDLYSKEAEYENLSEQADNTKRALDVIDGRMKAINVTEDVGALTASVAERARPDYTRVSPKRAQTMGMALVVGLMAGLAGSALRELMEQRLRSAEEVSHLLALPVLGGVPSISDRSRLLLANGEHSAAWEDQFEMTMRFKSRAERAAARRLMERGQIMLLQPQSDAAEAYRKIRTAIFFGLSRRPAKTLLITSPSMADGKSTLASNLAIGMAQAGRRVLLIDADLRAPRQHLIFPLNDGPGLTAVMLGKAKLGDTIQRTTIEGLDIVPCGETPANPAELIESPVTVELLKAAASAYDQVIIDSPPLLPVSDARTLAGLCQATIMVLRAGKSTRRTADDALDSLASVGAPVLGIVVNDVPVPRGKKNYRDYRYHPREAEIPPGELGELSEEGTNGHSHGNGNGHKNSKASLASDHAPQITGSNEDVEHDL
jgi:polysaccharide biosynthesis transport protein